MKATLYTTNEKNVFAKKALFYNNEKSDNLCVVSVSKTPMCESFTGFGVAITGSSCYELSLMPEFLIAMVREAMSQKKQLKFFASPWSPPGWMKTSGTRYDGYMRSEYIDCYADYIIKFLKAYKEQGISIGAVTPQNEPETHHF